MPRAARRTLQGVRRARQRHALIEALRAKPVEIAIVGWTLPDMTGGAVLARVEAGKVADAHRHLHRRAQSDVLKSSIKGGAWGFVSKTEDPQVLLEAVVSVARGRLSLPYVDIDLLNHDPLEGLTARERELACCTCERLDQSADRGAHRHFAQHSEIPSEKFIRQTRRLEPRHGCCAARFG